MSGSVRSVVLLGATGLVGGHCLAKLIGDDALSPVNLVSRRPHPLAAGVPKVREFLADFEVLGSCAEAFAAEVAICALGTTLKKAGSREAFRRVDLEYALGAARLAKAGGTRHFILVSAAGAAPRSRIFYSRVKGELEEALKDLGFESLTILRPAFLAGDRAEFRLGERAALAMARPFSFLIPARFRPVPAEAVARCAVDAAREGRRGVSILESDEILKRA